MVDVDAGTRTEAARPAGPAQEVHVHARTPARPPALAQLDERSPVELRSMLELSERLMTAADAETAARALLETVVDTYGLPRGLLLAGAPLQHARVLARHGLAVAAPHWPGSSDAVDRAHEQQVPQVLRPGQADSVLDQLPSASCDVLVVPMVAEGRPVGALVVQLPVLLRGGRRRRVVAQLETCAWYGAAALYRVSRLTSLQRLSTTDDLTMIANRRGFDMALERELVRAARLGEQVSLVLLDLDHFKAINDTHGHPAGDEALRNVAAALAVTCRELDTAARYGGEEFAVVVPSCTSERAQVVADRLREAVALAPGVAPLTASAGVATYPDNARSEQDLVHRADEALLQAKRAGRNRTVVSTAKPTGPLVRRARRPAPDQPPDMVLLPAK